MKRNCKIKSLLVVFLIFVWFLCLCEYYCNDDNYDDDDLIGREIKWCGV